MNDLTTQTTGAVATSGNAAAANYFTQYGEQAAQKSIVGHLLKFSKGDYTIGDPPVDIPEGTQLAANMDELMVGWIKWADNKPVEQLMGRIAEGFVPAKREALGDLDKALWEVDEQNNQPKDPWQFSNYLVLKVPGSNSEDDLFTFATSSRGGLNAIGEVCKVYGKVIRSKPDQFPVISLGVDSYMHKNKAFGRIKVPQFKVVGWVDKIEFEDAMAEAAETAERRAVDPNDDLPF